MQRSVTITPDEPTANEKERAAPTAASCLAGYTPRRLATGMVAVLFVWTALLGVTAHLSGFSTAAVKLLPSRRVPVGLGSRRRLRTSDGSGPAAAADEQLERRWTEKLLADLQQSSSVSADEGVSATLAELHATLAAREDRLAELERASGGRAAVATGAPAAGAPGSPAAAAAVAAAAAAGRLNVPRYDPKSVKELQKAALEAALPSEVKGPVPQLVRDLSAALTRQQDEHEALTRRLALLQPSVLSYNPTDLGQLSKAVGEATLSHGAEVSGALPKLLRDLKAQLEKQQLDAKGFERRAAAADRRKERSANRAKALRELVMGRASHVEDKVSLLFTELSDQIEQALEEARSDKDSAEPAPEGGYPPGAWSETMAQLQPMVLEELKAWVERNSTAHGLLGNEAARRAAAELTAAACAAAAVGAPAAPAAEPAALAAEPTEPAAPAAESAAPAGLFDIATPAAEPEVAPAAVPAAGACAEKRCPAGYDMIDRGDRCTCRPAATQAQPAAPAA